VTWRHFFVRLPQRFTACWGFKVLLTVSISTLFTTAYLLIGHYPLLPPHTLPETAMDRSIEFHPYRWIWVYQSAYLIINVVPWLAERREELARYAKGFALLSLVSFAIFILLPTRAPTPIVHDFRGMYWLLKLYDTPNNALPSLHVGLVTYTLLLGWRIFGDKLPRGLGALCIAWGLLIAYSTLATKEHYFVDVPAGAALAVAAHWWAWRPRHVATRELLTTQTTPPTARRASAVEPLPARY
jgi:membrane-associated phospholipid phosphatase